MENGISETFEQIRRVRILSVQNIFAKIKAGMLERFQATLSFIMNPSAIGHSHCANTGATHWAVMREVIDAM